ncbi:ABC transporter permease [Anaeromicropila herbilytica]|uniref:Permease n=1 Tax=Anaeromicropila herbilytica TaxID=2785025 RepID=A0A7R7EM50_9FIRM|nr:ABC transporter permease [Anaeromicropila herbilytica]BCN31037.1 permease [Anaeromicropila herbilytica]
MLEVLNNDWKRLLEEKMYLCVSIALTICSIVAAIVLTNTMQTKGNIAMVVTDQSANTSLSKKFSSSPYFHVSKMKKAPLESDMVQNRYDAIVTMKEDGSYNIKTIKSDDMKKMIVGALNNPDSYVPSNDKDREIGTNIMGYMMMFVLIQGLFYARFFAKDKEEHIIKRVVTSPIAFRKYLFGHATFILGMIFAPTFAVILIAKILGVAIGFSLLTYALLIAVLSILATAFALFLNSFFCVADTANMIGTATITLTTILAGSFYSFTKKESVLDKLVHLLPQKDFINYVNALEKGHLSRNIELQFIYVLVISAIFFLIAVMKTKRDYVYR